MLREQKKLARLALLETCRMVTLMHILKFKLILPAVHYPIALRIRNQGVYVSTAAVETEQGCSHGDPVSLFRHQSGWQVVEGACI